MPVVLYAQADTIYNGIKFEETLTWPQIEAKARTDNKYIFVDCYATWCGPCKMMDRDVYSNPEVGSALNDKFMSVKVQMDTTTKDSEQTKKWYITAKKMLHDYKIKSFPTYLFFSPNGDLVHREVGFRDAKNFVQLAQQAMDPERPLFYIKYKNYKKKKKEYATMDKLAIFTRDIIGDHALADKMARDYKDNYLDKLNPEVLYTKEHIDFIFTFDSLVHITDAFFALAYEQPERFDSIRGIAESAKSIITQVLYNEEIAPKVVKNGRALTKLPNWNEIEEVIAKKYSSLDAGRLVLNYKIDYYRNIYKDWKLWAEYKDELIKTYPPKPPYGLDVFIEINGHGGAWHAFLHCSDSLVLSKALQWADLAIKLDGENKHKRAAYMDTKANLLYKLGRRVEALKLQKEAIELSQADKNSELWENFEKMQLGEPTWPIH